MTYNFQLLLIIITTKKKKMIKTNKKYNPQFFDKNVKNYCLTISIACLEFL